MTASARPPVSTRSRVFPLAGMALACLVVLLLGFRAAVVAFRGSVAKSLTADGAALKLERSMENGNSLSERETTRGGDAGITLPPRWVPSYPGMLVEARGEKQQGSNKITGSYTAKTKDRPERLEEYFNSTLKADGFETTVASTSTDGNEATTVHATNHHGTRKITVTATSETGWTNLVIRYEEAK